MSNVIRVVAAVVDTKQLTLYKEDGSTLVLQQGDPRIRPILDAASPVLARGGVAEISLGMLNEYRKFEENSGGKVNFFSIAKKKLAKLFSKKEATLDITPDGGIVGEQVLGNVPTAAPEPKEEEKAAEFKHALDEIMQHAIPVTSPDFVEVTEKNGAEQTVIAVVEDKIIPDVHKIKPQIAHANALSSPQGVENFLSRLAKVVDKRSHSVEDLLKFMERGDLPISESGDIIIYKVLKRAKDKGAEGEYRDCHTGLVPQKVGSYVCMDESLVDPNRHNECSNGLHVARRGYIRSFSGDCCVIAKVAPEDVIAVPNYDANKMRVCGYHILFELPASAYAKLKADQPITDDVEGRKLVGKAITGDHVGKLEEVRITKQKGGGIKITSLVASHAVPEALKANEVTPDCPEGIAIEDELVDTPVDPRSLTEVVIQAQAEAIQVPAAPLTRQEIAQAHYVTMTTASTELERKTAAQALRDYKKKVKLGWAALGLKNEVVTEIAKLID